MSPMLPLSVSSLLINGISHKITQQEHFSFRPRIKKNTDKTNRWNNQWITSPVLRWFYDPL